MSRSPRLGSGTRQIAVALALLAGYSELAVAECSLRESEAYNLNTRLRQAHEELIRKGDGTVSFTHRIRVERPHVVVLLPAERVSKDSVQAADLPLEAKELIQSQIDHGDLPGAVLGLVHADRSEWHPVPDGISVTEMLYAWKQPGESVTLNITRRGGLSVVEALR
jgi:hypothetical protein